MTKFSPDFAPGYEAALYEEDCSCRRKKLRQEAHADDFLYSSFLE